MIHETSTPSGARPGLPLPMFLPLMAASSSYCVVTPLDNRGRLADRSPVLVAGWAPGRPVGIAVSTRRVLTIRPNGPHTITGQGHLRIPAPLRHLCHLNPGDRLLLITVPDAAVITAYPMSAVEQALGGYDAGTVLTGGADD